MDKLKMMSMDKVQGNIEKIRALFPNAVTEVLRDGKPTLAVDFDVLKQELADTLIDDKELRYQFTWPDKQKSVLLANTPIDKTLRPVRQDEDTPTGADSNGNPYCSTAGVDFDTTQNLYIEGDNLEVLKLLQETYLGKIKMIYIDPPYNTGNDFVYEDDFSQNSDEYLEISGQYDEQGNRLFQNTESNGRFHTDWLNMIYPRLRLAKDLLSDDGVIFISIDEHELHNLNQICQELFGNSYSRANIDILVWQKTDAQLDRNTNAKIINRTKSIHEYIVCCFKNKLETVFNKMMRLPQWNKPGTNPDNDERGAWQSGIISFEEGHAKEDKTSENYYTITTPTGRKITRHWFVDKNKWDQLIAEDRIYFPKGGDGVPRLKTFQFEEKDYFMDSILRGVGTSSSAKDEIEEILGNRNLFDTPKPEKLLRELIRVSTKKDSIILDFFSGSATTAHAVMQLNAEDGGNRKFIMVQLPEPCDEKSEAYKAGYKTICEIGKERIRRAGAKIYEEKRKAKGQPTRLDLYKQMLATSEPEQVHLLSQRYDEAMEGLDVGFRVLKLDTSNMQRVYYHPDEYSQTLLDDLTDNIKADRTPLDLLFQVMLEHGKPLSAKIEEKDIAGKHVFIVNDGDLIACFDESVTEETVKAIAQMKPNHAVFRDSSLANDSTAANFDQIFATYSPTTTRKVL